jgi:phospholipid/cholesterol/gamma-HCH transport system substrate-binding protein
MRKGITLEIWVGFFALLAVGALLFLAFEVSNLTFNRPATSHYELKARFTNIGGLKPRSAVRMAGVKIGEVTRIYYDQDQYEAVAVLSIDTEYSSLPEDTSASILTSGLLGDQYVGLDPGGMPFYLQDGDDITLTQSAMVIEKLIGEFLFRVTKSGGDND